MRLMSAALMLTLASCSPSTAPEPETATPTPAPAETETPPPAPIEPPVPGGYSAANLEDETVKAAQALAVDEIYKREPQRAIVEKVDAEQQVVAGMNYHFTITMSGGTRYGVTVFRSLDGAMTVTDFAKLT